MREFHISKLQTLKRMAGFGFAAFVLHAISFDLWWQVCLFYFGLYTLLFAYKVSRDRNLKAANEYVRPSLPPTPTQTSSGSNGLKVPTPLNYDQ